MAAPLETAPCINRRFSSRGEYTAYLKAWSLENGFSVLQGTFLDEGSRNFNMSMASFIEEGPVYDASFGRKTQGAVVVYTCNPPNQCNWTIRATKPKNSSIHTITAMNLEHSDTCASTPKASVRQIAQIPAIAEIARATPNVSARNLSASIRATPHGGDFVSRPAAISRAKKQILESQMAMGDASYAFLPWLLRSFEEENPKSHVELELDTGGRFFRAFVSFGASVDHMSDHLPIIGSDGTFFKASGYPCVLLNLIQRDANKHNITLAVAIVPTEYQEHYFWFLRNCMNAGVRFADFALFADRGKITNAVRGFRRIGYVIPLKHCTVHLVRNVHSAFGHKGVLLDNAVWKIQGATSANDYTSAVDELHGWLPKAADYLRALKPVKWTVHGNLSTAAHPDKRSLFVVRSSNFVESDKVQHNSIHSRLSQLFVDIHNGVRFNLPFAALFIIMEDAMTTASKRVAEVEDMDQTRKLTPYAAKKYEDQKTKARGYNVSRSSSDLYYVNHKSRPFVKKSVHVEALTCSCVYRDQMHMPCRHLIRVLAFLDLHGRILDCFHPMFLFENYKKAVAEVSYKLPLFDRAVPERKLVPATSSGKSHLRQHAASTPSTMQIASIVNPTASIGSPSDSEFESDSSTSNEAGHDVGSLGFAKGQASALMSTEDIASTDINRST